MPQSSSPANPLADLSVHVTGLVAETAPGVVAVQPADARPTSGFVWRPGLVVADAEAVETGSDGGTVSIVGHDGKSREASVVGSDPSTAVALLKADTAGLTPLTLEVGYEPAAGQFGVALGRARGRTVARLVMVSAAGGPWRSMRGGAIDHFVGLDMRARPFLQGAPVFGANARVFGMVVFGPRRSVLAIPSATIERIAAKLESSGRIENGYLGLGLQPVRLDAAAEAGGTDAKSRGLIVVSLDPNGPGRAAGMHIGDVVLTWDGEPVRGLRHILRRLGPDSVGQTIDLSLLRAGAPASARLTIGTRPAV
jgi:S1-C subfamily serine protease